MGSATASAFVVHGCLLLLPQTLLTRSLRVQTNCWATSSSKFLGCIVLWPREGQSITQGLKAVAGRLLLVQCSGGGGVWMYQ